MNPSNAARSRPSHFAWAACLLIGLVVAGCENREEVARTESEKEANRIFVELARAGIGKVEKLETKEQRKSGWSISVMSTDANRAREILLACDLPREARGGFKAMAEQGGMIPTKSEERAKLIYAMSEELSRTFETYDRVIAARVHIVLPEKDPLRRDSTTKPSTSATVMIKYTGIKPPEDAPVTPPATRPGQAPDPYPDAPIKQADVQQIVSKSVEGLSPDSVFVAMSRAEPLPTTLPSSGGSTTGDGSDRKLMIQLLAAAAIFGVISILLTALLVREKRRQRLAQTDAA